MMPADFARLAPSVQGPSAAGDYFILCWARAMETGRTDAGRPGLPRSQEVYS
jgi:hypothetical protein